MKRSIDKKDRYIFIDIDILMCVCAHVCLCRTTRPNLGIRLCVNGEKDK